MDARSRYHAFDRFDGRISLALSRAGAGRGIPRTFALGGSVSRSEDDRLLPRAPGRIAAYVFRRAGYVAESAAHGQYLYSCAGTPAPHAGFKIRFGIEACFG